MFYAGVSYETRMLAASVESLMAELREVRAEYERACSQLAEARIELAATRERVRSAEGLASLWRGKAGRLREEAAFEWTSPDDRRLLRLRADCFEGCAANLEPTAAPPAGATPGEGEGETR